MKNILKAVGLAVALSVAVMATTACFDRISGPTTIVDVDQNQNPSPSASPSPSTGLDACAIGVISLGFVNDVDAIPANGVTKFSLTISGTQGAPLPEVCKTNPSVILTFDQPIGPCTIEGSWRDSTAKLRANATAAVGQTCTTAARSGTKASESVTVTIVASS